MGPPVSVARAPISGNSNPVTTVDFRGKTVTLQRPAERIICLIESATSGLYMLDAEKRIVGISTSIYQKSVFAWYANMDARIRHRTLPTPGNWDFVNVEMLVGLQPDLVIIWSQQKESIAVIEEKGISVYGVFIKNFEDVHKEIHDLGILTGTGERAKILDETIRAEMAEIHKKTAMVPPGNRTSVYFMWAQGDLATGGKNSSVQNLVASAGAENVAAGIEQEHVVVNMETVIAWRPDVIVMWHNDRRDPEDIMKTPMWRSVPAVKNRRVFEFPDVFSCDLWTLKYPQAVRLVARWCYPEQFMDTGLSERKALLFKKLYGEKLELNTGKRNKQALGASEF